MLVHAAYNMRNITHSSSVILPNAHMRKHAYMCDMQKNVSLPMEIIKYALAKTGMSPSALCKKAGKAPSVLNKKANGSDTSGFSYEILTSLAEAAGYSSYEDLVIEWKAAQQPYTLESIGQKLEEIEESVGALTDELADLTVIAPKKKTRTDANA